MGCIACPTMVDFLRDMPGGSAFVFINFYGKCAITEKAIEELLIQAKINIDVLSINGDVNRRKKFAIIRLFTGSLSMDDFIPLILIAIAAANTEIDKELIEIVIQKGIPRDLITAFQERVRMCYCCGSN